MARRSRTPAAPLAASSRLQQAAAFERRGDLWNARKIAAQALASPDSESEKAAARAFLERTGFPKMAVGLAVIVAVLLSAMVFLGILRG